MLECVVIGIVSWVRRTFPAGPAFRFRADVGDVLRLSALLFPKEVILLVVSAPSA